MITIIGTTHLFDHETLRATSDAMSFRRFVATSETTSGTTQRLLIDNHTYGGELRLETDLSFTASDDERSLNLSGECRLFEGAFESTTDEEGRFSILQSVSPGFATPFSQKIRSTGRRGGDFGQLSFIAVHDFEQDPYRLGNRIIRRPPIDFVERSVSSRINLTHDTRFQHSFVASGVVTRETVTSLNYRNTTSLPNPAIEPAFYMRCLRLRTGEIAVVIDFENIDSLGENHGERNQSDTFITILGTGDFWQSTIQRSYKAIDVELTIELYSTFPI